LQQWTIALGIAGPVLCYLLTRQGQTYVERFFASYLAPGSISEVNYAQKVGQVPGTVAIAIALTGFAAIARHAAEGGTRQAAAAVARAIRTVLALVVPCTAVLVVLSPLVVRVLFERGAFTASDAAATASTLRVYVLGLPAQALVTVLVIAIAAMGSSRWLAAVSATCGLGATAVVAAALGGPLGTLGIAAADAVGIWVTGVILLRGVWRSFGEDHPVGALPAVLRTTGASLVAALAAEITAQLPLGPDVARLVVAVLAAAVAGLAAARALHAADVLDFAPAVVQPPAPGRHRIPVLDRGGTS
jgi:putative peptidoglycan lipid II flippase